MPTFQYTLSGQSKTAMLDAPDRASAVRQLLSRGLSPLSVTPMTEMSGVHTTNGPSNPFGSGVSGGLGGLGMSGAPARLSRAELAMLVRELATAVSAGLPIVQSLRTIAKQGRNARQRAMLNRVVERIEQGRSLAEACSEERSAFNALTVNLMRAGEASGKLDVVLMQAADLLDREVKLRRSVLAATLYPMILGGLITIAVIVIVTVIVPQVLKNVPQGTKPLPTPTRVVQGVAAFFGTFWWIIIPGCIVSLIGVARLYAQPAFRLSFDRFVLKTPLLGRVMRDVAVARFTRTLGTLVSAGLGAVPSLRITKGTLGNKAMEGVIDRVCEQVSAGQTLAEPMEQSGYFPPMLVQIINLGERSGRLDQLLNQAAGAFEDRTETSIKLFMTALPPLLVIVLAGVVGFVVLAILLPLLQMQESIG